MGVLTNALTQLRDNILALRSARRELIRDLGRGTKRRRADTSHELGSFSRGFAASSKRARVERCDSITDLRDSVSELLGEVRSDLQGIRQVWLAPGTAITGAVERLEPQVHLETAADEQGSQGAVGSTGPRVSGGGQKPLQKKRKR
jgi:hypothetical protein